MQLIALEGQADEQAGIETTVGHTPKRHTALAIVCCSASKFMRMDVPMAMAVCDDPSRCLEAMEEKRLTLDELYWLRNHGRVLRPGTQ